jgi:hypothetical protein
MRQKGNSCLKTNAPPVGNPRQLTMLVAITQNWPTRGTIPAPFGLNTLQLAMNVDLEK